MRQLESALASTEYTGDAATPYTLSVSPTLSRFRPELEFACDFLDCCHEVRRVSNAHRILHFGPDAPPGSVAVPAALFPDGVSVDADGIHPVHKFLEGIKEGSGGHRILPMNLDATGTAAIERLDYDALGLVFLLLSRLEARGHDGAGDRYGRFPLKSSIAHRHGLLSVPLADIAARDLAAALTGSDRPISRTRYEVWLTHDVDRLRGYHTPLQTIKEATADVVFRRRPAAAAGRIGKAFFRGRPWPELRMLMDLSEVNGLTSRFYFMGPTNDRSDSPYTLREPMTVRRLADEIIARGHVVGFHPGVNTHGNPDEWCRQHKALESVIGREIREGRQHRLLFDPANTWDIWDANGMDADATLGFPELSGYPSGTCRAHPTYSLRHRRRLRVMEHPTNVLDFGFFGGRYRDVTVEAAVKEVQRIAEQTKSFGGNLVILFHTGQSRLTQFQFYQELFSVI